MCLFHLLSKSTMLTDNQTYANTCKLLMALLMLGPGDRDRNTAQGATGARLNCQVYFATQRKGEK